MIDMGEVIRQAFERDGMSILQLSKRAGVAYATAHGFVNGNSDLTLATVSKICDVLGLQLRPGRKLKGGGR